MTQDNTQTQQSLDQLTPNFHLSEFVSSGSPRPSPDIVQNITYLAQRLQVIRDLTGCPIMIHSGYRAPERNKSVGGASQSLHLKGLAVDISAKGMSHSALQKFLSSWSGGLGSYATHTHIDIRSVKARWNN